MSQTRLRYLISSPALFTRCFLLAAMLFAGVGHDVAAQEPKVVITGGVDETDNYRWVVTNHHSSPIVFIEFPHYRADMFTDPTGWQQECTYLVNVGVPDKPGYCRSWVDSPRLGIQPNHNAEFLMRISGSDVRFQGKGEVLIRFADETSLTVEDVPLSTLPSTLSKYTNLIAFGIVFVLVIVFKTRRRGKGTAQSQ